MLKGLALFAIPVDLNFPFCVFMCMLYVFKRAHPPIHTQLRAVLAVFSTNDHDEGLALLALPVDLIYIHYL